MWFAAGLVPYPIPNFPGVDQCLVQVENERFSFDGLFVNFNGHFDAFVLVSAVENLALE